MAEAPTALSDAFPDSSEPVRARLDAGRIATNYVLLVGGEFLAKLVTFLAFTYLGRTLGAARYGSLEFVLAALVFFTLPVDLGLGVYGAREIAKDRDRAPLLLIYVTRLRALLMAASLALFLLFTWAIDKPWEVKQLLMAYGCSLPAWPFFLQWFFQAHDRMGWVAWASIVRYGLFAGLVFLFIRPQTPLYAIGLIECAAVAGAAAFCLAAARQFARRGRGARLPLRATMQYLREAAPIGLTELTWAFLWYIAMVLLGFMVIDASLGWFGASHRALMALHTFVWLYFFNLLPSISRCVAQPPEALASIVRKSLGLTSWGGVFVALTLSLLAADLLRLAYGSGFAPGGYLFATLVWIIPVALVSGHCRYALIAYNLQRWLFRCTALAAATVVALCLLLIPKIGALGAAYALVAGCTLELTLVYVCMRRFIARIDFLPYLIRPVGALAVCLAGYAALAPYNRMAAALAASTLFFCLMIIANRRDIPRLAVLVARRRSPWDP
ncbi:MAG: oligosaccharide flippase family protein [Bryobacteraceae bacterium]|nr:oligosaccharide flippase family protein [Bryobacteraceae bacterium]